MKLNVNQVAEKLGISGSAVRSLRDRNLLKDIGSHKEGNKKVYSLFDSKEVNEFAKTYKRKRHTTTLNKLNGRDNEMPKLSNLFSRLDAIEKKLNTLIEMWK